MTLAEVQSACNAKIGLLWPSFQVLQNDYFQKHGKYFQVLKNGGGIDGTETQFSIRTPVDEKHESDIDKSVETPDSPNGKKPRALDNPPPVASDIPSPGKFKTPPGALLVVKLELGAVTAAASFDIL